METGLLHTHNLLRWIVLVLLFVTIYQAFTKNNGIRKSSLWLLIASHITLLIGLYQWFTGNFGLKLIKAYGMGDAMKMPAVRFWAVEHITGMLVAIVLITIARGKAKTLNYKAASWLYLLALVLILAVIPWPFREGIGRPWFPGMKNG
jgi:glucan phosphoethanolaminetransferase (alkaline phosphatase superfamily)